LTGLVSEWLESMGGLEMMGAINARKAARLYGQIDNSSFYSNPVDESARSWMNVPFTLADAALDTVFLDEAEQAGLTNLKGHRSVGGMRASIYNAVPEAAVEALCAFMSEFEQRYG
ncbi:MAG: aminotransferase class V-fold PLP-dependent enzyme, partial [Halieaceae bacterium]|nr:aminotransferase class V-fold PLP-dependent enzyme [Halieaceae bacterium]